MSEPARGAPTGALTITPVRGIPAIRPGDDLAAIVVQALQHNEIELLDGDVLVVSSKVVSKSLGLVVSGRDKGDVVASQSGRVVTERRTSQGWVTRVVEAVSGPVMAAAGVDASNTGGEGALLVLPADPDGAAADLRARIRDRAGLRGAFGLVVSDTAGRPWRMGQTDFALGAAGMALVEDHRGRLDVDGRTLSVTLRALGDEVAGAADLVKGKDLQVPVAHLRGLALARTGAVERARDLVRSGPEDWFAYGVAESVRTALGVPPGTQEALDVGLPLLLDEPVAGRFERALRLAAHDGVAVGVEVTDPGRATLTCPDPVELGRVLGRLDAALWAEGLTRTARADGRDGEDWLLAIAVADRP